MPNMPSMTGACDGPRPSVNPGRPMTIAAAAMRLAWRTGCDVYVCRTDVPSSMLDVSRPTTAIGVTGSPATALGYHSALNPSASACLACSIIRSTVAPPPFSPMRMARNVPDDGHCLVARRGLGADGLDPWASPCPPLGAGRADCPDAPLDQPTHR